MAKWLEFTADHDHTWPSRAVTAFKKGQKVFVKDEVAERALAKKRANEIDKPADNDPARVTTGSPLESPADEAYAPQDAAPPAIPDTGGHERLAKPDDVDDVGPAAGVRVHVPARKR